MTFVSFLGNRREREEAAGYLERQKREQAEAERRERERHIASLDAEVDRQIAAERTAGDGEPVDPVEALRAELVAATRPLSLADIPRLPSGQWIRNDEVRRRRAEREAAELERRELVDGTADRRRAWDESRRAIEDRRDRELRAEAEAFEAVRREHEAKVKEITEGAISETEGLGERP